MAGLETLQRLGASACLLRAVKTASSVAFRGLHGPPFSGSKAGAGVGLLEFGSPARGDKGGSERAALAPPPPPPPAAPPRIVNVSSLSVEADLTACAASAAEAWVSWGVNDARPPAEAEAPDGTPAAQSPHSRTPSRSLSPANAGATTPVPPAVAALVAEGLLLEVAVAAVAPEEDEPPQYETVYCGNSARFTQAGLSPDCAYLLRCRASVGAMVLEWSPPAPFHTDAGVCFTFDPLKVRPLIRLEMPSCMRRVAHIQAHQPSMAH